MKTNTKKRLIWLAGGMILSAAVVLTAWNYYGFGEYARTASADYSRIEAAGFPLDAKSFAASLAVPDDENNGRPLYDAFSSLDVEIKRLDANSSRRDQTKYRPSELVSTIDFNSPTKTLPADAERADAFDSVRPHIEKVRAVSGRPHYVPEHDWNHPENALFTDLSGYRMAVKILSAEATLLAKTGESERAIQNLELAQHLTNLIDDIPTAISILVQYSGASILSYAVIECSQLDPANAPRYRAPLSDLKLSPGSRIFPGEAFFMASMARNLSLSDTIRMANGNQEIPFSDAKKSAPLSDLDLPDDPLRRAYAGYAFRHWYEILRHMRPDGTVVDQSKLNAAIRTAENAVASDTRPVAKSFRESLPLLTSYATSYDRTLDHLAVAFAASQVAEYKHRTGKWPADLTAAGISGQNAVTPASRVLGFAVKNGKAEVWSVRLLQLRKKQGTPESKGELVVLR